MAAASSLLTSIHRSRKETKSSFRVDEISPQQQQNQRKERRALILTPQYGASCVQIADRFYALQHSAHFQDVPVSSYLFFLKMFSSQLLRKFSTIVYGTWLNCVSYSSDAFFLSLIVYYRTRHETKRRAKCQLNWFFVDLHTLSDAGLDAGFCLLFKL